MSKVEQIEIMCNPSKSFLSVKPIPEEEKLTMEDLMEFAKLAEIMKNKG